ncbi:MAG: hypothetical protein AAF580_07055 [Pseudomonadota bacterium]
MTLIGERKDFGGATLNMAFEVGRSEALTKSAVNFTHSAAAANSCAKCAHFLAEQSTCQIVEGPIAPSDGCSVWVARG